MKTVEGVWVLAMTGDTRGYLARVTTEKSWEEVKAFVYSEKMPLVVSEAYDYFSPIRSMQGPNGQMALGREQVVTGLEFTLHPVEMLIDWKTLMFLDALHPSDQTTYEGFILAGRQQVLAARARQSNLVLPQEEVPSVTPDGKGGFKLDLRDLTRR